eukprot:6199492-Pleurochrysis_carterae.AAC.1
MFAKKSERKVQHAVALINICCSAHESNFTPTGDDDQGATVMVQHVRMPTVFPRAFSYPLSLPRTNVSTQPSFRLHLPPSPPPRAPLSPAKRRVRVSSPASSLACWAVLSLDSHARTREKRPSSAEPRRCGTRAAAEERKGGRRVQRGKWRESEAAAVRSRRHCSADSDVIAPQPRLLPVADKAIMDAWLPLRPKKR